MSKSRILNPVAAALLLAVALTGCSTPAPEDSSSAESKSDSAPVEKSQSVEEGCSILQTSIKGSGADLELATTSTDIVEVAGIFAQLQDAVGTARDEITNDQIAPVISDYFDNLAAFGDFYDEVQAADGDQTKLAALNSTMIDVLTDIQGSGAKIESLCF